MFQDVWRYFHYSFLVELFQDDEDREFRAEVLDVVREHGTPDTIVELDDKQYPLLALTEHVGYIFTPTGAVERKLAYELHPKEVLTQEYEDLLKTYKDMYILSFSE